MILLNRGSVPPQATSPLCERLARPPLTTGLCCWLMSLLTMTCVTAAADLPEALTTAIESGTAKYQDARAVAAKELQAAFESEIKSTRRQAKLKAEEKLKIVEEVTAEQKAFSEHGVIPFSPRMRPAMVNYLKRLKDARKTLSQIYDKAIDHHTKAGDNAAATTMAKAKATAFDVRCIACWQVRGVTWEGGYPLRLLDDFTIVEGGTWSLEKNAGITLRVKSDGKLVKEWIESCVVDENGQVLNATNQLNGRWRATLSASEANLK